VPFAASRRKLRGRQGNAECYAKANGATPLAARETRALPDSKFVKKLLLPVGAVRPSYMQT
jgi:hypothetical protein